MPQNTTDRMCAKQEQLSDNGMCVFGVEDVWHRWCRGGGWWCIEQNRCDKTVAQVVSGGGAGGLQNRNDRT